MTRRCPLCRKQLPKGPQPFRPFCSWRCKLLDLGRWLGGSYRLRGGSGPEDELGEVPGEPEEETPLGRD